LAAKWEKEFKGIIPHRAVCEGPISYVGEKDLAADLANLKEAIQALDPTVAPAGVFVSAASPGIIHGYHPNAYYATDEEYEWAIADAMKQEYDAIYAAGFTLQLDCPDLGGSYRSDEELAEHRKGIARRVAALNHALRDIPAEAMRMHICWGNSAGPHNHDTELKQIIDLVLEAKPAGVSFEAANPRHAHEWAVWETVKLPEGKYLIPGVIDSTTNFVEHPELVAERVLRYASVVGPERVMAGVDCGMATAAGYDMVDRDVAWVKLGSLVEGTRLANEQLKLKQA
jgi:5-methyltetrahydropteroyltriglutamate--homocysteine methyltransferase